MMRPVVFEGCFGWLHQAPGGGGSGPDGRGIVLCAPYGYEALCVHAGWRALAESLAAAGHPALRFDYPGAGDSAGEETDPDRLEAWLGGIAAAVRCLRAQTGVQRVVLCGLRLGGALAALAATRPELVESVDALVLLAPAVSGKVYLRELRAFGRMALGTLPAPPEDGGMETAGYRLTAEATRAVAAIDLAALPAAPADVLLLAQDARSAGLAPVLRALGARVQAAPFAEHDGFLRDALLSATPLAMIAQVVDFLTGLPPAPPRRAVVQGATAVLALPHATEQARQFGPAGSLFGMLCVPNGPARRKAGPAVVIVNTGANHHVGNARLSVALARMLAAEGTSSLRIDVAGLGDSDPVPGSVADALYHPRSVENVCQAVALLVAAGYPGCVVVGLCSGAWMAVQAAWADRHVVGLMAINLQRFIWRPGTSLQVALRTHKKSVRTYVVALSDRASWRLVLKGEVDLFGIARILGTRLMRLLAAQLGGGLATLLGADSELRSVRRRTRALAERGARMMLLYSDDDPGLDELATYFGPGGRWLRRFPNFTVATLTQADHSLNAYPARARMTQLLAEFVGSCPNLEIGQSAVVATKSWQLDQPALPMT